MEVKEKAMETTQEQEAVIKERLQEKLALAREFGMKDWVKTYEPITTTFKPISREAISKKLKEGKFIFKKLNIMGVGLVLCFMAFLCTWCLGGSNKKALTEFIAFLIFIPLFFTFAVECVDRIAVDTMSLLDWTEEIPYGALLAVKEAKEQGFENFRVWYPVKQSEMIKADPVITARKNYKLFEIFFWDAGKIYE